MSAIVIPLRHEGARVVLGEEGARIEIRMQSGDWRYGWDAPEWLVDRAFRAAPEGWSIPPAAMGRPNLLLRPEEMPTLESLKDSKRFPGGHA